jgi:hypothetical protein
MIFNDKDMATLAEGFKHLSAALKETHKALTIMSDEIKEIQNDLLDFNERLGKVEK